MTGELVARSTASAKGGTLHRSIAAALTLGAISAFAFMGSAPPASAKSHARAGGEAAAVAFLRLAVAAPDSVSYFGTRVVFAASPGGASTVLVDVRHVYGQGTRMTVRGGASDGSNAMFLGDQGAGSQGLHPNQLSLLVDNFDLRVEGPGDIAGRKAVVVSADHPGVASAKFWIDRATGLLLRTEVYGADGRLWRASAFVRVSIHPHLFMQHLPPIVQVPDAVALSRRSLPSLRQDGYRCPAHLRSGFALTDIDRVHEPTPAVHMTYTDGLSVISVFEQRGSLAASAVDGYLPVSIDGQRVYVKYGLPTSILWASNDMVYTVLTDAPDSTLAHIVAAYPSRAPESSDDFWSRLWRGLGRLIACAFPLAIGV
ncbi:MAG: sigma-E factor regulatory protein RseB domain-containing protein [Nocardioidaceae bacterium]